MVSKAPTASVRALSEMMMVFVAGFLNRRFFKMGIIAAGSVEASTAPSKIAEETSRGTVAEALIQEADCDARKAVKIIPGIDITKILNIDSLNCLNGVSNPPPNKINVAASPTITPRSCVFAMAFSKNGRAAIPKKIAVTKEGMRVLDEAWKEIKLAAKMAAISKNGINR